MDMAVKEPRAGERRMKFLSVQVKGIDDERKVITFRGTTAGTDRDGDEIVPQGGDLTNYRKNPVFLWAHDWRGERLPIGKSLEERVIVDVGIDFDIQFDTDDPFAMQVYGKYRNGYLNAVSVGFDPKKWEPIQDPDGRITGYRFLEWELLELSGCPIPANPDALQRAVTRFLKRLETEGELPAETVEAETSGGLPLEWRLGAGATAEEAAVTGAEIEAALRALEKTVTPYADLPPAPKDRAWDRAAAVRRVREWAGGEESTDCAEFRKAFCWYDPDNAEAVAGYKLPIADVVDGELKVVYKAVVAVMSALNGARGGVDIPDADRRAVYSRHIKRYYAKFDEEAPELRSFAELVASLPFQLTEDEGVLSIDGRDVPVDLVRCLIENDMDRRAVVQTLAQLGLSEEEALELLRSARKGRHEPSNKPGITIDDLARIAADAVEARVRYLQGRVVTTDERT